MATAEGKTKEVYELPDSPGKVLLQSKDQITAGNAARKNHLEGKAAISNKTTSCISQLLKEAGIKTAFPRKFASEIRKSGQNCSIDGLKFDLSHCEKIKKACGNFGIPCELRVILPHKGPEETED
uniref:phosphoribosylaminoimidazolesuccinocarboxamide synthase n=1 Tax=Ailuropoda melanoleuca TaxID=9646 RepID=A0A7N5JPS9_AILME